jgi:hypothetical protein
VRFEDEDYPGGPQHRRLPGGVRVVKLPVEIPVEALIAERPWPKD